MFKTPASVQSTETDVLYREIIENMDKHPFLKKISNTSKNNNVIFFIYRGGYNTVILVTPGAKCNIVDANISKYLRSASVKRIYVFCYTL